MAIWALQLGVLEDGLLEKDVAMPLAKAYKRDWALRQMQARNLMVQLFSERPKIELAEALLGTDVPQARQIAGIEFEQWVGRWAGIDVCASLKETIDGIQTPRAVKDCLHRARETRNHVIHCPRTVRADDVRKLIEAAVWVRDQLPGGARS